MADSFNKLFDKNQENICESQSKIGGSDVSVNSRQGVNNDNSNVLCETHIYCSQCGQRINKKSNYCRFCGSKVEHQEHCNPDTLDVCAQNQDIDCGVATSEEFGVKIERDTKLRKSTVANEIVSNLTMIGVALILWVLYMIGFVVYHSKDIAPVTETSSYFGESCYDKEIISGNWEFSWEKHLAMDVSSLSDKTNKFGIREVAGISSTDYLYISNLSPERALKEAQRQAKTKRISDEEFSELKQRAQSEAEKDRSSFNQEISDRRKQAYEEDLHNKMFWAAIIPLFAMIMGRYFILACKWVAKNKTD